MNFKIFSHIGSENLALQPKKFQLAILNPPQIFIFLIALMHSNFLINADMRKQ